MNFYSILLINLKTLAKAKIFTLSPIVKKKRSFNLKYFYKLVEVNKNEKIGKCIIQKSIIADWYIKEYSVDKTSAKLNRDSWLKLLRILQIKKKIFLNESPKVKDKVKTKTIKKKKK